MGGFTPGVEELLIRRVDRHEDINDLMMMDTSDWDDRYTADLLSKKLRIFPTENMDSRSAVSWKNYGRPTPELSGR